MAAVIGGTGVLGAAIARLGRSSERAAERVAALEAKDPDHVRLVGSLSLGEV